MQAVMKFGVLAGLLVLSGIGSAAGNGSLELKTVVEKVEEVTSPDGETVVRLVPVDAVVPGEEVVYTVNYTNISDTPAENIVITNPIPRELTYIDGSAFGPGTDISFSVDGGASYADPASLTVIEDGVERTATVRDFTNIRWEVKSPVDGGEQGFARFRARLN